MSKFLDAVGLEWRIEFDGFLLDRIDREAKIDLADLSAEGILSIERDVKALVRVLSVACSEQIQARRKTPQDFQRQVRRDAITEARAALTEALADFFPQSEWSAIQSNLAKLRKRPIATENDMRNFAQLMQMDKESRLEMLAMIREQMADGNSPLSPANESASGPVSTPSMLADTTPANAESVPETLASATSG